MDVRVVDVVDLGPITDTARTEVTVSLAPDLALRVRMPGAALVAVGDHSALEIDPQAISCWEAAGETCAVPGA